MYFPGILTELEIETHGGFGRPQAQCVHRIVAIPWARTIIGHCKYDLQTCKLQSKVWEGETTKQRAYKTKRNSVKNCRQWICRIHTGTTAPAGKQSKNWTRGDTSYLSHVTGFSMLSPRSVVALNWVLHWFPHIFHWLLNYSPQILICSTGRNLTSMKKQITIFSTKFSDFLKSVLFLLNFSSWKWATFWMKRERSISLLLGHRYFKVKTWLDKTGWVSPLLQLFV